MTNMESALLALCIVNTLLVFILAWCKAPSSVEEEIKGAKVEFINERKCMESTTREYARTLREFVSNQTQHLGVLVKQHEDDIEFIENWLESQGWEFERTPAKDAWVNPKKKS